MKNLFKSSFVFGVILFASSNPSAFAQSVMVNTEIVTQDQLRLGAKWTLPATGAPKAVVLLLSGSGNVGTDGDVSGPFTGTGYKGGSAKLNDQLAESLAESGIGSLRFAKRGFEDPAQLPNQLLNYIVQDSVSAF